ncbi:MAG TPA: tRNA (adenosine(37)-N6)-dimethylallyltransferase MiaA [Candidatus Saccharimonadales bacterium]
MPPKMLVIVGETASGKSDLALKLAEQYDGELICADSWTVRQGMDIGTAKPSTEEQARVTHHLLDIVQPDEDFSAAVFKRLALQTINDIAERGRLPILVGGTGLYVDGVIFDYNFLPVGEPGLRDELNNLSIPELLARIDASGLELGEIDVRNKRRLIRLLETGGAEQTKETLRANTLVIGLQPERLELKERITARVDAMLAAGLEQEVVALSQRYGWDAEGLKGIGYREWQDYFLGSQSLPQTRDRIISSTVGLAKRQRTWFKRNKSIHWLTTPVDYAHIDELVTTFLNN